MWSLADPLKFYYKVASDADRGGLSAFMEFLEVKFSSSVVAAGETGDFTGCDICCTLLMRTAREYP